MNARLLLSAGLATLITSCGRPEADTPRETVSVRLERRAGDLAYEPGANVPFSGEVVTLNPASTRRVATQSWQNGRPHGLWRRYQPTGQVRQEQTWVHGEQVLQKLWYDDGSLREEIPLRDGEACGLVRKWWPGGRLRRIARMESALQPHGQVLEYDADGHILTDAIYHHGQHISGVVKPEDPTLVSTN